MGDIYNIFSKKKLDKSKDISYKDRFLRCSINVAESGKCDCSVCTTKKDLVTKNTAMLSYLCIDAMDKTGEPLYLADVLEIALLTALNIKNAATKKD